ncbi:hypothetical protein QUF74_03390 [Candidatus Halobeggiatoa sp. HSG11]|nr:hypothetical protein [Candidatus Halobeggiatoa sp. HSG11]
MPKFPVYEGELPACLSPFNPRHYWLLIYWVFFRPTAFKCYLYQADEELYKNGKGKETLLKILHIPAYRYLYLMIPIAIFILSLLITAPLPLLAYLTGGILFDISEWVFILILGIIFSIVFGVAMSIMGCKIIGVASGVVFSVTASIAFGTAVSTAFGTPLDIMSDIEYFIAFGVILSTISGIAVGIIFSMAISVIGAIILIITLGFTSIYLGIAIITLGSMRAIFYPIQWFLSLLSRVSIVKHPFYWDEFVVFPLTDIQPSLERRLQTNEQQGLTQLATIMANPFQRWQMQRFFYKHSHNQPQPLYFIYNTIVNNPKLDYYIFVPVEPEQWKNTPNYNQLLLGELASKYVKSHDDTEKLVWHLTKRFRNNQPTPLTEFAGLLYELTKINREDPATILNQSWAKEAYTNVNQYPNGEEISQSFAAFTTYINYQTINDIANAAQITLPDHKIRPNVLTALNQLQATGSEITTYQKSTSRTRKLEALSRANDNLEQLKNYVATEVTEPERYILEAIIDQWQPIITTASGEIARFQITEPITDPYIAGNPVSGTLFVGREDILRQFTSLWKPEKCPSIVLFGHRRMGKTSILQNLRSQSQANLIYFNMQLEVSIKTTGDFLHSLAIEIYDELEPDLPELNKAQFIDDPYLTFKRFLKKLDKQPQRIFILIDEFEAIEQAINEGRMEPYLLEYLRGLIITYNWFIITLAGLHTLNEMRHDYWHPFFQGIESIHVSFLSDHSARQLITEPDPDFPLEYTKEAIDKILQITHNQPYLIQRICKNMIRNFNEQMFNNKTKPSQILTITDVQTVIDSKDFYRDATAYFNGIWTQANTDKIQPQILKALIQIEGLTLQELQQKLPEQNLTEAIKILKQHDVIRQQDGKYIYNVELMRWWVLQYCSETCEVLETS